MPADDLVLNVRQIAGYPPASNAPPGSSILIQLGGLGGAYASISPAAFVGTALAQGGDMTMSGAFSAASMSAVNAAFAEVTATLVNAKKACVSVLAVTDGTIGGIPIASVADVAGTVTAFNSRTGAVNLWLQDILEAGGAPIFNPRFVGCPRADTPDQCSNSTRLATTAFVQRAVVLYLDNLLRDHPFVFTFNGRSGIVTLTEQDIIEAGGGAVFDNVALTGIPTAPTAAPGTNTVQIATTAFVNTAISNAVANLNGIYAPLISPEFSGIPAGPTADPGTSTGQLASTAFVMNAVQEATTGVVSFNSRTGIVVLTTADIAGSGGALLTSPAFTGSPTAPTAAPGTANTQLATTAFVMDAVGAGGVASFNGRSGDVTLALADITGAGGAPITSPTFTGSPQAPTPPAGDADTSIATTAFVAAALVGTVTTFNSRSGAVTLTANDVSAAGGAPLNSPALYGLPTAPTAAIGTNTTQIATTAFVENALAGGSGVTSFNGRGGIVTLTLADVTGVGGAPLASPALIGTPTAPTATAGNSSGQLATTAFVMNALGGTGPFLPLSGGTVSGPLTVAAATVLGPSGIPSTFDANGRASIARSSAIPANAGAGSVFITTTITSNGGWNFTGNLYNDGTNWRYLQAGVGAYATMPAAGAFSLAFYPSGAAGAVATGGVTALSCTSAGNVNASGTIVGAALVASTGQANLAGSASTIVSMFNGSAIFSDANFYIVGLSGPGQSTTSWRNLYIRSSGQRIWYDFAQNVLMTLVGGGNLTILGTLSQASDARLKRNIVEAPDGMDAIRLMRPRRYHRVHTQPPADQPGWRVPDREELGFVAQEVQEALPHAVKPHDENTLALDLMALIAALTNAVKELDARLATMEARAA